MDLTGLYPELLDDGSIALYNEITKEMDYAIPAPFMYDALGNMSEDVAYTLVKIKGIYYLQVIANAEWINEEGRTFPVTIDPTIVNTITSVEDTYISSDNPSTNNGSNTRLWVRSNRIPYIKFPTPNIPSNNYLHWASLAMYYYYFDDVSSGAVDVSAHYVTEFWSASTLTWNSCAWWSNNGLSGTALCTRTASSSKYPSVDAPELLAFDITEAVRLWNNGTTNYGIGLKYQNTSSLRSVLFSSAESLYDYKPSVTYQYGPSFKLTLELLYDNGYNERYSNASQRIRGEVSELQDFYSNLLDDIEIDIGILTPQIFHSHADSCSKDYTQACRCGVCDSSENPSSLSSYHHKNIYNIFYRLPTPKSALNATVAYIGHKTCTIEGNNCVESNIKGLGDHTLMLAVINNLESETLETITLIHEVGHLLDAPDHYALYHPEYYSPSHEVNCLYGGNKSFMTEVSIISICQGCRNRIKAFVEQYKF